MMVFLWLFFPNVGMLFTGIGPPLRNVCVQRKWLSPGGTSLARLQTPREMLTETNQLEGTGSMLDYSFHIGKLCNDIIFVLQPD